MLSQNSLVNSYRISANRSAENSRFAVVRTAIEKEYRGLCDIAVCVQYTDAFGIIRLDKQTVLENQPCRLSFESIKSADRTETSAKISQRAKLFLSPDIKVLSGSKITVRQDGIERVFSFSSVPAVYPTHQEIVLELYENFSGEEGE